MCTLGGLGSSSPVEPVRWDVFCPATCCPDTVLFHILTPAFCQVACICKVNLIHWPALSRCCNNDLACDLHLHEQVWSTALSLMDKRSVAHTALAPVKPSSAVLRYWEDASLKIKLFNSLSAYFLPYYKTQGFGSIIHLMCLKTEWPQADSYMFTWEEDGRVTAETGH